MTGKRAPLPDEEIAVRLADLPGWARSGDELTRTYAIPYDGAVAMIVHAADIQRRLDHHADIDLRYGSLRFTLTTHSAGRRLTLLDFELAHRVEEIAAAHGAD